MDDGFGTMEAFVRGANNDESRFKLAWLDCVGEGFQMAEVVAERCVTDQRANFSGEPLPAGDECSADGAGFVKQQIEVGHKTFHISN